VLRPGGRIAFAGEPSRVGDRLASIPKRGASLVAPVWRTLMRAGRLQPEELSDQDHSLEAWVDIHAFSPGELAAYARRGGLVDVHVRGEELTSNWFGWFNRALEATAGSGAVTRTTVTSRSSGSMSGCLSGACRRRSSTTCC